MTDIFRTIMLEIATYIYIYRVSRLFNDVIKSKEYSDIIIVISSKVCTMYIVHLFICMRTYIFKLRLFLRDSNNNHAEYE